MTSKPLPSRATQLVMFVRDTYVICYVHTKQQLDHHTVLSASMGAVNASSHTSLMGLQASFWDTFDAPVLNMQPWRDVKTMSSDVFPSTKCVMVLSFSFVISCLTLPLLVCHVLLSTSSLCLFNAPFSVYTCVSSISVCALLFSFPWSLFSLVLFSALLLPAF